MTVKACNSPKMAGIVAWDCGGDVFSGHMSGLPTGPECPVVPHGEHGHNGFHYQFQGGSADEASLVLPPGFGIPVGGETGLKSLVVTFHFPKRSQVIGSRTGVSGIDFSTVRPNPGTTITPVGVMVIGGQGYVGRQSLGTVVGTHVVDHKIHPLSLYSHFHDLATEIKVEVGRGNGQKWEEIMKQDPRTFRGVTSKWTNGSAYPVIESGDRLKVQCTFNNTFSSALRIE